MGGRRYVGGGSVQAEKSPWSYRGLLGAALARLANTPHCSQGEGLRAERPTLSQTIEKQGFVPVVRCTHRVQRAINWGGECCCLVCRRACETLSSRLNGGDSALCVTQNSRLYTSCSQFFTETLHIQDWKRCEWRACVLRCHLNTPMRERCVMKRSIPLCVNGRGCVFAAVRSGCYLQSHGGMLLDHNMETKSQREESREYSAGCSTHGSQDYFCFCLWKRLFNSRL